MNTFLLEAFSFVLIPWYLYCTAWIGRELFALSGMTFWEFVQKGQGRVPTATSHRRSRSRRTRAVLGLLLETSSDPEETQRLFRRYCYSTLPAFLTFIPSLIPGMWGKWKIFWYGTWSCSWQDWSSRPRGKGTGKSTPVGTISSPRGCCHVYFVSRSASGCPAPCDAGSPLCPE